MADKKRKGKNKRVALFTVYCFLSIMLCFFVAVYFTVGYYLFAYALDATFSITSSIPSNVNIDMQKPLQKKEWFAEIDKSDVYIKSFDDYTLHGYQIKNSNSNKWVICVHGYRDKAEGMSLYAYYFYNHGFNVLLPDLKGHGKSEGMFVGMGFIDRHDILQWINHITSQNEDAQIALFGVSMGAAAVMCTVGEDLPHNVKVAVEDCGFSSVYEQYKYVAQSFLHMEKVDFALSSLNTFTVLRTGKTLKDMDCVGQLKKSQTPMLFIHGEADTFVPLYMLDIVYGANENIEKEKIIVPNATHAYSASLDSQSYFEKVFEFVDGFIT